MPMLLGAGASLQNEQLVFIVLIQLAVIILAARALAVLAVRLGQPAVVGEIAGGILLGPSCFGRLCPALSAAIFDHSADVVFGALSELGLILLVFVVGLEFDFSHLRQWGKAAVGMSVAG